jgi:hypothetical protein
MGHELAQPQGARLVVELHVELAAETLSGGGGLGRIGAAAEHVASGGDQQLPVEALAQVGRAGDRSREPTMNLDFSGPLSRKRLAFSSQAL